MHSRSTRFKRVPRELLLFGGCARLAQLLRELVQFDCERRWASRICESMILCDDRGEGTLYSYYLQKVVLTFLPATRLEQSSRETSENQGGNGGGKKGGKREKERERREERGETNRGAWGAARKGLRSKPSVALSRQLGGDSWVPAYLLPPRDSQPSGARALYRSLLGARGTVVYEDNEPPPTLFLPCAPGAAEAAAAAAARDARFQKRFPLDSRTRSLSSIIASFSNESLPTRDPASNRRSWIFTSRFSTKLFPTCFTHARVHIYMFLVSFSLTLFLFRNFLFSDFPGFRKRWTLDQRFRVGGANVVIIRAGFAIDAVAQTAVRCVRGSLPRVWIQVISCWLPTSGGSDTAPRLRPSSVWPSPRSASAANLHNSSRLALICDSKGNGRGNSAIRCWRYRTSNSREKRKEKRRKERKSDNRLLGEA